MNKEIKYQDLVRAQSLAREMVWQEETEVYNALKDYLRKADAFAQSDNLSDQQTELMNKIQKAISNHQTVLVRVRGEWYEARIVLWDTKVLVLDKRLPEVANEMSGDRVFIWEVKAYVINQ